MSFATIRRLFVPALIAAFALALLPALASAGGHSSQGHGAKVHHRVARDFACALEGNILVVRAQFGLGGGGENGGRETIAAPVRRWAMACFPPTQGS